MWDFSFDRAIGMVVQTLPFIVLRIIVYAGIALAYVFTVGIGGALGWGFGHMGASARRTGKRRVLGRRDRFWPRQRRLSISRANIFCIW